MEAERMLQNGHQIHIETMMEWNAIKTTKLQLMYNLYVVLQEENRGLGGRHWVHKLASK